MGQAIMYVYSRTYTEPTIYASDGTLTSNLPVAFGLPNAHKMP